MVYLTPECLSEFNDFGKPKHKRDYRHFARDVHDNLSRLGTFSEACRAGIFLSKHNGNVLVKRYFRNTGNTGGQGAGYRLLLYAVPDRTVEGTIVDPLQGRVYLLYAWTHVGSKAAKDIKDDAVIRLREECDRLIATHHTFDTWEDWKKSYLK